VLVQGTLKYQGISVYLGSKGLKPFVASLAGDSLVFGW
jgi:hypothetical protein